MIFLQTIIVYSSYIFWCLIAAASSYEYEATNANYCRDTLQDQHVKQISWPYLRNCLQTVNGEVIPRNMSVNIWRLMKMAFDAIDNIPADAYKYMGFSLTAIPLGEMRNISMETVEVVEAFGSIRSPTESSEHQQGFNVEQLNVIARKVRSEWLGKNPQTYSEYDLRTMGELLCYLNVTDIAQIHTEAFIEAAEWIGLLHKCPQDRLQALANIARRPDAFGEPIKWSKLEVTIIGNILNGLSATDINSIAEDKLQLNQFYKPTNARRKQQSANKTRNNTNAEIPDSTLSQSSPNDGNLNETTTHLEFS